MSNNHSGANGSSIQDIEREIDRDRSHFSETLSALENKLSPGQLVDQALSYAKRNGGDFSDNLVKSVANNPIPTILTGIGVAWMALNQTSSHSGDCEPNRSNGAGLSDKMSQAKNKAKGYEGQISDSAHQASDKAQDMANKARHSAQEIGARSKQQWQRTSQQAVSFFEENPLAIGAAAVAIGALIGTSVPLTSREKQSLGRAGEQMVDEAQASAESAKDTATEAGKAAAQAAKDTTAEPKASERTTEHSL